MNTRQLDDLGTPIREFLESASPDGLLLEAGRTERFALLPLSEDLLDYLLAQDRDFIEECREIRGRVMAGDSLSHDEVKRLLEEDRHP